MKWMLFICRSVNLVHMWKLCAEGLDYEAKDAAGISKKYHCNAAHQYMYQYLNSNAERNVHAPAVKEAQRVGSTPITFT
eukprot:4336779-Pleurochrysis_carterae.AAC.1